MDKRVHYFGEKVHNRKVVLLDRGIEVVLGSIDIVVVPYTSIWLIRWLVWWIGIRVIWRCLVVGGL